MSRKGEPWSDDERAMREAHAALRKRMPGETPAQHRKRLARAAVGGIETPPPPRPLLAPALKGAQLKLKRKVEGVVRAAFEGIFKDGACEVVSAADRARRRTGNYGGTA